jgi:hypothetical protein
MCIRTSVCPSVMSHIWFPPNNLSPHYRNRNKFINQIRASGGHIQITIMIDTQQQYFKLNIPEDTALRRKSKDWLARNQYNVSEWGDMSTRSLLFQ